jgi:hypothetical protein
VFDPTYYPIVFDATHLNADCDWKPFYGDYMKEPVLENVPPPHGKPVILPLFVDSNYAGDKLTHHSHSCTGYNLIYLNNAPINNWFLKKQ